MEGGKGPGGSGAAAAGLSHPLSADGCELSHQLALVPSLAECSVQLLALVTLPLRLRLSRPHRRLRLLQLHCQLRDPLARRATVAPGPSALAHRVAKHHHLALQRRLFALLALEEAAAERHVALMLLGGVAQPGELEVGRGQLALSVLELLIRVPQPRLQVHWLRPVPRSGRPHARPASSRRLRLRSDRRVRPRRGWGEWRRGRRPRADVQRRAARATIGERAAYCRHVFRHTLLSRESSSWPKFVPKRRFLHAQQAGHERPSIWWQPPLCPEASRRSPCPTTRRRCPRSSRTS